MPTDLFGQPIAAAALLERPRRHAAARPWRGGYAAAPGSGPAGERCQTCRHYTRRGGHSRSYPKCLLMKHAWTSGPGSDVKAKTPACHRWAEKLEAEVAL